MADTKQLETFFKTLGVYTTLHVVRGSGSRIDMNEENNQKKQKNKKENNFVNIPM